MRARSRSSAGHARDSSREGQVTGLSPERPTAARDGGADGNFRAQLRFGIPRKYLARTGRSCCSAPRGRQNSEDGWPYRNSGLATGSDRPSWTASRSSHRGGRNSFGASEGRYSNPAIWSVRAIQLSCCRHSPQSHLVAWTLRFRRHAQARFCVALEAGLCHYRCNLNLADPRLDSSRGVFYESCNTSYGVFRLWAVCVTCLCASLFGPPSQRRLRGLQFQLFCARWAAGSAEQ